VVQGVGRRRMTTISSSLIALMMIFEEYAARLWASRGRHMEDLCD
jgi:hypothetical protein